jgi:hypothetical protein
VPTASKGKQDKPSAPAAPEPPRTPESKDDKPKPVDDVRRQAEKIAKQLEETLGIDLPDLPAAPGGLPAVPGLPPTPGLPQAPASTADAQQLLDYLLAP